MKLYKLTPQKSTAQAMVEFAIVLPILLLLLYGLLEAGRLLFIYSTIVTASRQAARYGSATGDGLTPGIPRYKDCAGIRLAAQRVDFLDAFEDKDIHISHDEGPNATPPPLGINDTPYCLPGESVDSSAWAPDDNSQRLVVIIEGDYLPIVPRIVPFLSRSNNNTPPNPVRAISARTIITGVPIEVTPPPGGPAGPSPTGLTLTISADPDTFSTPGQTITLTFTLTNTGTDPIAGPFTITYQSVDGSISGSVTCTVPGPGPDLAPTEAAICQTGTLVITQAQLDAGVPITIEAISLGSVNSNEASDTITPNLTQTLSLSKTASTSLTTVGDSISYTFTLSNNGNVTLSPPYTISDDIMGSIDCGSGTGNLAPGASVSCAPVYVVNSAHVRQNEVVNTATATALFNGQTVTSNQDSATVGIYTGRLFLTVSASPSSVSQVGQVITYTYTIKNNWNQDLTDPYVLAVSILTSGCSFPTGTLAPNATRTCTGSYTVTQADFEAGIIRNGARASASRGGTTEDSNTVINEVTVTGQNPAISLQASASPMGPIPPSQIMTVGQVITYSYTVTNVGNVTLSSPITVNDPAVGSISCGTSLAPGAVTTCSGTHAVTDVDLNLGVIITQATAHAQYAARSQTVSAAAPPITIVTYDGPRLRLDITANPTTYPATGQIILLTYTLTNTGTVPLSGPYLVQDPDGRVTFIDCFTANNRLERGASTTCIGSTNVSGPPGSATTIRGLANASDGSRTITSNTASVTVTNPVLGCGTIAVSPAGITIPGASGNRSMTLTFTNPNSYSVTVSNVVVSWNPTGGPGDSSLTLQSATLNNTSIFSGSNSTGGPLTITPTSTLTIPGNNALSTITFEFGSNYQTRGNPAITINLSTIGCENTPIHSP